MHDKNINMWAFDVSSRGEYVHIKHLCIYKSNVYLTISQVDIFTNFFLNHKH